MTGLTGRRANGLILRVNMMHFLTAAMMIHHNTGSDLNDQNTQQKCQYAVL
ncbi:MAG: hypothetical protein IKT26_00190 [Bacteroidaceae bacterium]|nr:hypothetical protein [Bacteroidaceae bacterium]